jgi:hypothetical protein
MVPGRDFDELLARKDLFTAAAFNDFERQSFLTKIPEAILSLPKGTAA